MSRTLQPASTSAGSHRRTARFVLCVSVLSTVLSSCAARAPNEEGDPLEPLNRRIFWFNEQVDLYVLEPVAKGWNFVVPDRVQLSISNVFDHFDYPIIFVNDILQGKLEESAIASARFTLNSTVGLLGIFDPATHVGLEKPVEDFGQTFGSWGIPPGPYLVLPLFGPSNPRDAVGRLGSASLRIYPFFLSRLITTGISTVEVVNLRGRFFEDIDSARKASLDYYAFVRNAYSQRRKALINDTVYVADEEDDLYEVDYED